MDKYLDNIKELQKLHRNIDIEVIILKRFGINSIVHNGLIGRTTILLQSIKSLHTLMFELTAYNYTIEVFKQKDRQQEYIIQIEPGYLQSKLDIWNKQDREFKPL